MATSFVGSGFSPFTLLRNCHPDSRALLACHDCSWKLLPSDYRQRVLIVVKNNETEKTLALYNEGMSRIFRRLARRDWEERPRVASLAPAAR